MNIAKAIKICRTSRGYTQLFLAQQSGLSPSYVSLVEKGKREPTLTAINKMANALHVPNDLLLLLAIQATSSAPINMPDVQELSASLLQLVLTPEHEHHP